MATPKKSPAPKTSAAAPKAKAAAAAKSTSSDPKSKVEPKAAPEVASEAPAETTAQAPKSAVKVAPEVRPTVAAMAAGAAVDTVLLLQRKDVRPSRGESPYLLVELSDGSGRIIGVQFDYHSSADLTVVGEPVHVAGVVEVYRGQRRLKIRSLTPSDSVQARGLIPRSQSTPADLNARFGQAVNSIPDRTTREVVKRALRTGDLYARFREAPLSATGYGAWLGGAIEHTLTVASLVSAACDAQPAIDRSVAISAALLHQVGCVDAFDWAGPIIPRTRSSRIPRGVLSAFCVQDGLGDPANRTDAVDRIEELVVSSSAGVAASDAAGHGSPERVALMSAIEMAYSIGRAAARDAHQDVTRAAAHTAPASGALPAARLRQVV